MIIDDSKTVEEIMASVDLAGDFAAAIMSARREAYLDAIKICGSVVDVVEGEMYGGKFVAKDPAAVAAYRIRARMKEVCG